VIARGELLEPLWRGAAFSAGLWSHLRHPIDRAQARAVLERRLAERETDFLTLARRAIYGHRGSPYRRLLQIVGCEFGDLERLVRREGLEGALLELFRQGVYLTIEELKGKRLVTRRGEAFTVNLGRLRNPCRWVPSPFRGRAFWGNQAPLYEAMLADLAANSALTLEARGGLAWRHATWRGLEPSASVLWLLRFTGPGYLPVRWYTWDNPRTKDRPLVQRIAPRVTCWLGARMGSPFPRPEYVPDRNASPVLRWMEAELRSGRTPNLITTASFGIQVCRLAIERGIDLSGAQFSLGGDPLTPRRLDTVRQVGANAFPNYGSKESGFIAVGCLNPVHADEMHHYHDQHALIQAGSQTNDAALPPEALLITSLRLSWPLVLLNVSLGDHARLSERDCGCPLQRLGWARHLDTVRSFEKMKIAAKVVSGPRVTELLEAELPARFGGGPTDYQLVEELDEVPAGTPRLRLLVHPDATPDVENVAALFVDVLRSEGVPVEALQQQPDWFRVERRPPLVSAGGKTLPIHRD
jgi:hypothetical protein